MHPSELTAEMNYLSTTPEISFPFPYTSNNFGLLQNNLHQPIINLNNGFFQTPQTSSSPLNSTSDESEEHHIRIIDERRQRRMISNRESARRSRMRKQRHLDELWSQVVRLRNENHGLIDKLNQVSDSHDRVLQENARLKEEASDLRQMISSMQMDSPYNALRDLDDDVPCTTAHLRVESSNQSVSSSTDLLLQ